MEEPSKSKFTNFIAENISILMYIMCVILCLFSTLSCRVGVLQISIIIIIINEKQHSSFPVLT